MVENFTPEQDQFLQLRQSIAYYTGLREGVSTYAHWRDGVQYVGATGKTLAQALAEIEVQEKKVLSRFDMLRQI